VRRTFLAVALCAILIGSLSSTLYANPLRTVALSGTPAAGTPAGAAFDIFSAPQIDAFGRTMFSANVAGDGIVETNETGVWVERDGGLSLVLREGDAAPGFPTGTVFTNLFALQNGEMNREGDIALLARVTEPAQRGRLAIYTGTGGPLELVARTSLPMPELGASIANFFPGFSFNDEGQIAFGAISPRPFPSSGSDDSLWMYEAGSLELVARTGDAVPDIPVNAAFTIFGYPTLNIHGDLAFAGWSSSAAGVFERRNGATTVAAYKGMPAPGTGAGTSFVRFLANTFTPFEMAPAYNDAGKLAFAASLQGGGISAANDSGVWAGPVGGLELVVREGDQAPGLPSGVVFGDFQGLDPAAVLETRAVLDPLGHVSFMAHLRGPNVAFPYNDSIWSTKNGGLSLVARGGESPPDVVGNSVLGTLLDPKANAQGQIAFSGQLRDPVTNAVVGYGIWAEDQSGILRSIAQTGGVLEMSPGDFRTVLSVGFAGPPQSASSYYPSGSGFNDRGQVAFRAIFTDGSEGLFVSDLVAVPEPASWTLLAAAALASSRCRRRRELLDRCGPLTEP
jgi:hypothetical protein